MPFRAICPPRGPGARLSRKIDKVVEVHTFAAVRVRIWVRFKHGWPESGSIERDTTSPIPGYPHPEPSPLVARPGPAAVGSVSDSATRVASRLYCTFFLYFVTRSAAILTCSFAVMISYRPSHHSCCQLSRWGERKKKKGGKGDV